MPPGDATASPSQYALHQMTRCDPDAKPAGDGVAPAGRAASNGKLTTNVDPRFSPALSARIVPPWSSTM